MKMTSIRSHYGLLRNVLALAILLGALAISPPTQAQAPGWTCEDMGCIWWTAENGCWEGIYCCVNNRGGYICFGEYYY